MMTSMTSLATETCRICIRPLNDPATRVVQGVIVERCVCNCHDDHLVRPSNASTFVARARKSGLKGHGVGFGRKVCGR